MFNKNKTKKILLIDFGDTAVGSAIVSVGNTNSCPMIEKSFRYNVKYGDPIDLKYFMQSTTDGLKKSLTNLKVKPQEIHCFFSSPYFVATSELITYEENKSFKVNNKLINGLIEQRARRLMDKMELLYPDIIDDENHIIESEILSIKIDGYEVKKRDFNKVNKLEISAYYTIGSKAITDHLTEIINNFSYGSKIYYHTSTFATYSVIRQILPNQENFILMEASGELTDILLIEKNIISHNISFPFGTNKIKRLLNENLKTTSSELDSLIDLYLNNNLKEEEKIKLEKNLKHIERQWIEEFKKSLNQIFKYKPTIIPQEIYFISQEKISPLIGIWASNPDLSEFPFSGYGFNTSVIGRELTSSFCLNNTQSSLETIFGLEALFCKNLL